MLLLQKPLALCKLPEKVCYSCAEEFSNIQVTKR